MRTLLVGLVLMLGVQVFAQSGPVAEAKKAAMGREAASGAGDGAAWEKFSTDNCRWTNILTGEVGLDKKEISENISNNANPAPAKITDQKFHNLDGVNAVYETGHRAGTNNSFRYVRVWVKQDSGAWQTLAVYMAPDGQ